MDKYLEEAINEYEKNIELGSSFYMDASILMDIEEYYDKQGKQYDAERLMRFAEKLHPENDDIKIVKAYRLKSTGNWSDAIKVIKKIHNAEHHDAQLFWAEYDVASGQPDKAEERIAAHLTPDVSIEDNDWFLDLGEILLDYGYFERSIYYLNRIPEKYELRKRVDELIADAYYQLGIYDKSMEAFNRLIDSDPYDAISWTQLADIQQKSGKLSDCIVSCDYALALDDTNQQGMSLKLFATFGLGKYEEGLKLYEQYSPKLPNDYSIRMYAGEQIFSRGYFTQALPPLREALRLCPLDSGDRPRIINDMAYVLTQTGQTKLAEELMTSLCMVGTSLIDIYLQLATVFFESLKLQEAVDILEKGIHLRAIEDKDYIRVMQQLFQNKCFRTSAHLWKILAKHTPSAEYYPMFAYTAFAMHQIKDAPLYIYCIQQAFTHCPDSLIQIVGPIYDTTDLKLILQKSQEDAATWKN